VVNRKLIPQICLYIYIYIGNLTQGVVIDTEKNINPFQEKKKKKLRNLMGKERRKGRN